MNTITVSKTTYEWLQLKARESAKTPDQMADELLKHRSVSKHAYIDIIKKGDGSQAVIKDTRIPVTIIIGYLHTGETPESLVQNILPHLTLAQIYDALSYYYDYKNQIEQEMVENTEQYGREYLRKHLGEEGYLQITGQVKQIDFTC